MATLLILLKCKLCLHVQISNQMCKTLYYVFIEHDTCKCNTFLPARGLVPRGGVNSEGEKVGQNWLRFKKGKRSFYNAENTVCK